MKIKKFPIKSSFDSFDHSTNLLEIRTKSALVLQCCAFKMAKKPRAKNEVKAWAEKLLEHIRAKLSYCRTTDGSGNISQSSSGSKNFQLDNENILILAERELKKVSFDIKEENLLTLFRLR